MVLFSKPSEPNRRWNIASNVVLSRALKTLSKTKIEAWECTTLASTFGGKESMMSTWNEGTEGKKGDKKMGCPSFTCSSLLLPATQVGTPGPGFGLLAVG